MTGRSAAAAPPAAVPFAALKDAPGIIAARFDAEGRLIEANDQWGRLADGWTGDLPSLLRSPAWGEVRGSGHGGLITLGPADGESISIEGMVRVIDDGLVLVAHDPQGPGDAPRLLRLIQRLEGLHREAVDAQRAIRRARDDLESLIHGVVHDLGPPFRAIELALHEAADKPLAGDLADIVHTEVENAVALVDALNEYARSGRMTLKRERIPGGALASMMRHEFERELQAIGGTFTVDGAADVFVDPLLIQQVFRNVLRNAIHYRDERPLKIHWEERQEGDQVVVAITDNGTGVTAEQAEAMFDLLRRFSERSGSGIGLAFSRRIVEKHDGTIMAEPAEPGCRIIIRLPASASA